jgi:hypothetical protein
MTSLENFIEQIALMPWFANLGKPSPGDKEVFRIYDWHTWPGPQDPGSKMLSAFHKQWRHELFESAEPLSGLAEARQTIRDRVLQLTKGNRSRA